MAVVRYPIKLNIKPSSYPLIRQITLVQGDTANIFAIELQESKQPFNIENCHVTATFKKADENVVVLEGNVVDAKNGLVDIPIYSQVVAYPGKVYCTIEVYNMDNLRLTSIMFEFNVVEQLGNDEDIESTTEYTILQSLINEINTINEVEKQRVINEDERIQNEINRQIIFNGIVDTANTTKDGLDSSIGAASVIKTGLDESISTGNTLKANLDTNISTGATLKNNLDINITEGSQLKTDLPPIIDAANISKTNLDNSISTANITKAALDESIIEVNELKGELGDIIAGTDFEQVITDVNSLKQDQHNHNNKDILDGLSDVDGKLKYNGQDIGIGDMTKAEFDADGDGIVDKANDSNKLGGRLPSYYAQKTYVDIELDKKVDNDRVLTDVPVDAKFTDTTYSEITEEEIDIGTSSTLRTITGRRIKYILDKIQDWISALTKADVGLGNVQDYGVATQSEAETGTSDIKYMTPLKTKQAIDKFKPKDTSELTKSDVYTKTEVDTALAEKVDNSRVLTDVPENAKFTDTTYDVATTNTDGLMSATDKTKLNGIEAGANRTVINNTLTSTSTTQALSANQGKVLNDKINIVNTDLIELKYSELSSTATNIDDEGIYKNIEWKRKDNTLYAKSTLIGIYPYSQIKIDYYDEIGTTIIKTITWDLTYDNNDFPYVREVI